MPLQKKTIQVYSINNTLPMSHVYKSLISLTQSLLYDVYGINALLPLKKYSIKQTVTFKYQQMTYSLTQQIFINTAQNQSISSYIRGIHTQKNLKIWITVQISRLFASVHTQGKFHAH